MELSELHSYRHSRFNQDRMDPLLVWGKGYPPCAEGRRPLIEPLELLPL